MADDELVVVLVAPEYDADRIVSNLTASFGLPTIRSVTSGADALVSLETESVVAVLSAQELPDTTGLGLLRSVRERRPALPFLLFANDGDERLASEATAAGVTEYVPVTDGEPQLAADLGAALDRTRPDLTTEPLSAGVGQLVAYSSDVIAIHDENGTARYVSPAIEDVLGYEQREVIDRQPLEKIHPDDHERMREFFTRPGEWIGETRNVTYRFEHADGSWRTLESIGRNRLHDPAVGGVVVNSRDVTEREKRKKELERLETIVKTAPVGVHVLDEEDVIGWNNEDFAEAVGKSQAQLRGTNYQTLVDEGIIEPDVIEQYHEAVESLLDGNETEKRSITDAEIHPEDGTTRYYDGHVALLPPYDGEFHGTVSTFRDVTARKEYEEELERQNDRLEDFAAVISHDLRNPLEVAQHRLEYIRRENDSEHHETIAESLDRMEIIIEDVLALARQGRVVGDTEPVDLGGRASDAWQRVDTPAATLDCEGSLKFEADGTRLERAFENLFRNAIEHGTSQQSGGVTVRVGSLPDESGFYVADDGPGIPPDLRRQLFEHGVSTAEEGTGFGLAIVKGIVEAHGWSISVAESESGGARFEISGVERVTDEQFEAAETSS